MYSQIAVRCFHQSIPLEHRSLENNDRVIDFISNGVQLNGNSTDGFRRCLKKNPRHKERGKIFGSACRKSIAITLLVKKEEDRMENIETTFYYYTRDVLGYYVLHAVKDEIMKPIH